MFCYMMVNILIDFCHFLHIMPISRLNEAEVGNMSYGYRVISRMMLALILLVHHQDYYGISHVQVVGTVNIVS